LQENDMWSEDLKGWWQMAVVFAAGFAVLFVVAVVAGSVWTLFLWGVTSIGIGCGCN